MIVVEERRHHAGGEDRVGAEHTLALGKTSAYRIEPAHVMGGEHGDDAECQQADDERLLFDSQQRDQIGGRERHSDNARQQGSLRFLRDFRHALRPAR